MWYSECNESVHTSAFFFGSVVLREVVVFFMDLVAKDVCVVDVLSKIVEDVIHHLHKGFL